jgi:hypothetical protein
MVETGPWQARVRFAPGGGLAYRPGELLVRAGTVDVARATLAATGLGYSEGDGLLGGTWVRFTDVADPLEAIEELRRAGVVAQANNVLFASTCCPPHPADPQAEAFYASPFYASPFYASPFYASPFYASPFYASAGMGSCCCSSGSAGANPFYASPFYASPFYASADPNPAAAPWMQATGRRRSSARPADPPEDLPDEGQESVRIAILDTGYAEIHQPGVLPGIHITPHGGDRPDEDGDNFLDPAAGHGTFIAGVIEQLTPGCDLEVFEVLSTYGDGDEATIADQLSDLSNRPADERPHFVNLSFGGYSPLGMAALADAITALDQAGTVVVASAGNDGTCVPQYPAVLPEVVAVGALDEDGNPAPFTNYGPWVRACTVGVEVVSSFYEGFNGAEPPVDNVDADDFHGWARWSGTSFAAPRVVAALARRVIAGGSPQEAVELLIENEQWPRKPMLGTVVLP